MQFWYEKAMVSSRYHAEKATGVDLNNSVPSNFSNESHFPSVGLWYFCDTYLWQQILSRPVMTWFKESLCCYSVISIILFYMHLNSKTRLSLHRPVFYTNRRLIVLLFCYFDHIIFETRRETIIVRCIIGNRMARRKCVIEPPSLIFLTYPHFTDIFLALYSSNLQREFSKSFEKRF